MGRRPRGGDPVAPAGLQVGGGGKPGQVGGTRRGHRGLGVGPPAAHLDHRPARGRGHDQGRRRGDGRVVVEDRQHEGLQQHGLAEGPSDGQHRRAGRVELAFGVAVDGAARTGDRPASRWSPAPTIARSASQSSSVGSELESLERVEQPAQPGEHPVPPTLGQPAGEHLEGRRMVGHARPQGGVEHGQLVVIGEQRRRRFAHGQDLSGSEDLSGSRISAGRPTGRADGRVRSGRTTAARHALGHPVDGPAPRRVLGASRDAPPERRAGARGAAPRSRCRRAGSSGPTTQLSSRSARAGLRARTGPCR